MVFIKRLEMRGFKSFGPHKVSMSFEKGLTVITGPNGSGKSNIFDAMRFVLGDLSARSLRADKMSEVIFDGISDELSSKVASVTVHLDNTDHRIPVESESVTISRRVNSLGVSEYFLNGRQVARGQLVDMLSLAGLSSNGYNMIMQGTITRLADITPDERRKFIEELVGISEYDAKKAEAQIRLQQADMNLKIATARISDIEERLERLEEERNDALRYNFIQAEIKKLQAALTSHNISLLSGELAKIRGLLSSKAQVLEKLKKQREDLQAEWEQVESERRRFDEEVADQGSVKLFEIQKSIGEINAQIAACKVEIESANVSLEGFLKMRNERIAQLKDLENRVKEAKELLSKLCRERDKLRVLLDNKKEIYKNTLLNLTDIKKKINENTIKIKSIDEEIIKISQSILKLDNIIKTNIARSGILSDSLKSLKDRFASLEQSLISLQKHLDELQKIRDEEQKSIVHLEENYEKSIRKKENLQTEVAEGENVANFAREAVIEFESQRNVAERFLGEEASLQRIEEMVEAGILPGVLGRLDKLVSIDSKYEKALVTASYGWLKALVVEDAESALRCIELLKKMRLSQVRFIPLKELKEIKVVEIPKIEGILGLASSFVRSEDRYLPAIYFVFGDTLVAAGEKAAFFASKAGYRAVDIDGDLYEASGAMVAGFYRAPIKLSSIVPSRKAIESLTHSVESLKKIVIKRREEVNSLEGEILRLAEERARRAQLLRSLEEDILTIKSNITRAKENVSILDRRIQSLGQHLDTAERTRIKLQEEKEKQRKHLIELAQIRKSLKLQTRTDTLTKLESEYELLGSELGEYEEQLTKIELELKPLEATLNSSLRPSYEAAQVDLNTIEGQIKVFEQKVSHVKQKLEGLEKQLSELERARKDISASLVSVKDKRREFEERLDKIDVRLKKLTSEYESLGSEVHALELDVKTKEAEIKHLEEELQKLGYEKPLTVAIDEVKNAESRINLLRLEIEQLGSINQLAISQYDEQQKNFKELSIRRTQLELERGAIINFMEEIENKKKETFMQAFNSINNSFSKLFSKLTGGGDGYLSLQNPEDPFSGGVDIFVRFPGKGSRLIAGASGGEKSIAAVAFIFAIQSLSPAPFYILDEIDAHLDPYNTERLADLLKEQAAFSQFIVITLRDVVMERADRLFGVYIQDGISKIVALKVAEAAA
jgi:chromosome segregation protein